MALPGGDLNAPEVPKQLLVSRVPLSNECDHDEDDCLRNTQELVAKEKLELRDFVSWVAYRASKSSLSNFKPAIISLLLMFVENANSFAMIVHPHRHQSSATVCLSKANSMYHCRVQRSEPCRDGWGILHRDGVLKNSWEVTEWQWMDRSYVQCWSSNTGGS